MTRNRALLALIIAIAHSFTWYLLLGLALGDALHGGAAAVPVFLMQALALPWMPLLGEETAAVVLSSATWGLVIAWLGPPLWRRLRRRPATP